jgi:hypothetical protein
MSAPLYWLNYNLKPLLVQGKLSEFEFSVAEILCRHFEGHNVSCSYTGPSTLPNVMPLVFQASNYTVITFQNGILELLKPGGSTNSAGVYSLSVTDEVILNDGLNAFANKYLVMANGSTLGYPPGFVEAKEWVATFDVKMKGSSKPTGETYTDDHFVYVKT